MDHIFFEASDKIQINDHHQKDQVEQDMLQVQGYS